MPLGKTPAEIIINIDNKYYRIMPLLLNISPVSKLGVVEEIKDDVRQALKDLLDYAIAEMPDEIPSDSVYTPECHPFEISSLYRKVNNNARNDCIAVLSKLKESV